MEKRGPTAEDMSRLVAAFSGLAPVLRQMGERLGAAWAVISPAIRRAEEREWELIQQRVRQQRVTLTGGFNGLAYVDNLSVRGRIEWDGLSYLVSDGGAWHSFDSMGQALQYAQSLRGFRGGLIRMAHIDNPPDDVEYVRGPIVGFMMGSPDETIGATLDDLIGRNDELERTMREDLGIQ